MAKQEILGQPAAAQEHTEVNFLASAGTGESYPENIDDEE
jgi:hypothetical protein